MLTKLVDYEYYSKNYGGSSIPESSFNNFSIKASAYVNKYTSNRINDSNINDNIKNCTCEIVDLLYSQNSKKIKIENDKLVASETVGKHSKSYVNNTNLIEKQILDEDELNTNCFKICYKYLASTGLMNRSVKCFHIQ